MHNPVIDYSTSEVELTRCSQTCRSCTQDNRLRRNERRWVRRLGHPSNIELDRTESEDPEVPALIDIEDELDFEEGDRLFAVSLIDAPVMGIRSVRLRLFLNVLLKLMRRTLLNRHRRASEISFRRSSMTSRMSSPVNPLTPSLRSKNGITLSNLSQVRSLVRLRSIRCRRRNRPNWMLFSKRTSSPVGSVR